MENPFEARERAVRAGVCPDCGAKLKGIDAARYNENATETPGGRFVQCTAQNDEERRKVGKQPCTFKAFILDEPMQDSSGFDEGQAKQMSAARGHEQAEVRSYSALVSANRRHGE